MDDAEQRIHNEMQNGNMTEDQSIAPETSRTDLRRPQTPLKGAVQDQVANVLTAIIAFKRWHFFAAGEEVSADKVAGPLQMLPALMWQVEKMHRIAYGGISTGLLYEPSDKCPLGASVIFPENRPRSPLLLFAQEALHRSQENYPVPGGEGASVDHIVQEFLEDRDAGLIPWVEQKINLQPVNPA